MPEREEGQRLRGSPSWRVPRWQGTQNCSLSEPEGRLYEQHMISRMENSVMSSISGRDKKNPWHLMTCPGLPCAFWPSHHLHALTKQQTAMPAPRMGKGQGPRATLADIPPRGNQGQIHKELQGWGGRKERWTAKHCPGHNSATQPAQQGLRQADTGRPRQPRARQRAVGRRGSQNLSGWQGVAHLG